MAANTHPSQNAASGASLVVIPVNELSELIDGLFAKHLRTSQSNTQQHQAPHPPKAAFRTRKEAAKALGLSLGTINTRLHDGTIPFERIGRRILIPESFFTALEQRGLQTQA